MTESNSIEAARAAAKNAQERAERESSSDSRQAWVRALIALGEALLARYEFESESAFEQALREATRELEVAPSLESERLRVEAHLAMGHFHAWMSRVDQVRVDWANEGLALAERLVARDPSQKSKQVLAQACLDLAEADSPDDPDDEASKSRHRALLERALSLGVESQAHRVTQRAGLLLLESSELPFERALAVGNESVRAASSLNERALAESHLALAEQALNAREVEIAERHFKAAIEAHCEKLNVDLPDVDYESEPFLPSAATAQMRLAELARHRGALDEAEHWLRRALDVENEFGGYHRGVVQERLGSLLEERGQFDEAEKLFAASYIEVQPFYRRHGDPFTDGLVDGLDGKCLHWCWSCGEVSRTRDDQEGYGRVLWSDASIGPSSKTVCSCSPRNWLERGWCSRCKVELISTRVRQHRFTHVELAAPVLHPWALDGALTLLGLPRELFEQLLRGEAFIAAREHPQLGRWWKQVDAPERLAVLNVIHVGLRFLPYYDEQAVELFPAAARSVLDALSRAQVQPGSYAFQILPVPPPPEDEQRRDRLRDALQVVLDANERVKEASYNVDGSPVERTRLESALQLAVNDWMKHFDPTR
jgi:tetratricopeptide (TPR) repeat protein